MCLVYGIRPDIVFVVEFLNRYNADPKKGDLQVAKIVI